MVLEFSLKNFLSYKEKTTIKFNSPHTLLVGSNASGKSNLSTGLFYFTAIIKQKVVPNGFLLHMCDKNSSGKSSFEILLKSPENVYFKYTLECNFLNAIIENEKLEYSTNSDLNSFKKVFYRDSNNVNFAPGVSNGKWNLDTAVKSNLAPIPQKTVLGALFDSYMKDREYLQQLYSIIESIQVINEINSNHSFAYYNENNPDISLYYKFGYIADNSFKSIVLKSISQPNMFPLTTHQNSHIPLQQNSNGTGRMLLLAPFIVNTLKKGGFLCIDEFEYALHPNLVESIVDIFHDKTCNTKNAQLLLIGHSGTLMRSQMLSNSDIWISQKDTNFCSHLYNLAEYYQQYENDKKVNNEERFESYITGKLFSSPNITHTLDTIKMMIKGTGNNES